MIYLLWSADNLLEVIMFEKENNFYETNKKRFSEKVS